MRLFVAVVPTAEVRNELASVITVLQEKGIVAKWVRPENLHITLKFLGEVEADQVAAIAQSLDITAQLFQPFSCSLTRLGTFPARGQPRVLYMATEQSQRLESVATQLAKSLFMHGFPIEKKFQPHITLGRFRPAQSAQFRVTDLPEVNVKGILRVSGLSLLQSRLSPQGASYQIVSYHGFGK